MPAVSLVMEHRVTRRIGFLGTGQMARALAAGWLKAGLVAPTTLAGSDVLPAARDAWKEITGVSCLPNNAAVVAASEVVVLAVKPQTVPTLLDEMRSVVTSNHLVVSIAAGISLARLESGLGNGRRVVRVMPNTPCLVGAAASGLAIGAGATDADAEYGLQLFRAVGSAFLVPESLLDAVTGLSGSGPAYVYQVIEALSDGGVSAGLPRDVATALAAQTVLGAAKMVLETRSHPGELKDMVTSPAGTTIAGLAVLERAAVRGAFIDAVRAATDRARELGRIG